MNAVLWAAVLQWSRLAISAAVFLGAARFLSLTEIGAFATAFAPVRLIQGAQRTAFADAAVIGERSAERGEALTLLSSVTGLVLAGALAALSRVTPPQIAPLLLALAVLPLVQGLSAVAEGRLRQGFHLRALALRTLAAQGYAAGLAALALWMGGGAWSLVAFALGNTAIGAALTLAMSPLRLSLPVSGALVPLLPEVSRIAARDLAGSAQLPLAQLAIAATLGLPAAGAFQLGTRILALTDALALAPLRFLALPRFAALIGLPALVTAFARGQRDVARLGFWLYPGLLLAAPEALSLALGPAHVAATLPLMPGLCALGLSAALAMPLTQALTASGRTGLPLIRALAGLGVGAALAAPMLAHSAAAVTAALGLASALVLAGYARAGLAALGLPLRTLTSLGPPAVAALAMAAGLTLARPLLSSLPDMPALGLQIGLGTAIYAATLAVGRPLPMPA